MGLESFLALYEGEIKKEISAALTIQPSELADACKHLALRGKLLRPLLVLVSCEAVGGNPSRATKAAAAVELLHTFTLIHDDIIDESEERRGVKAVHILWGLPLGIIAGDVLFARAFEMLNGIPHFSEVVDVLSSAMREVCEGQAMDVIISRRLPDVGETEYLEMISKKTGSLMEASAKIGAILGEGNQTEIRALSSYGRLIGMAFQIKDDVLSLTSTSKEIGKPGDVDIKTGRPSLPILKALRGPLREFLVSRIGRRDLPEEEVERVRVLIMQSGVVDESLKVAEKFIEQAKQCLSEIPSSSAKEILLELADYTLKREK